MLQLYLAAFGAVVAANIIVVLVVAATLKRDLRVGAVAPRAQSRVGWRFLLCSASGTKKGSSGL
jgi:hypothetical protein